MLVYNVQRRWFAEKADAEAYRKLRGLKPNATIKVVIDNRLNLALLLNALCEPGTATPKVQGLLIGEQVALVDRAYVEPTRSVPDCVPLFLINDHAQREAVRADRAARGCTGEE